MINFMFRRLTKQLFLDSLLVMLVVRHQVLNNNVLYTRRSAHCVVAGPRCDVTTSLFPYGGRGTFISGAGC